MLKGLIPSIPREFENVLLQTQTLVGRDIFFTHQNLEGILSLIDPERTVNFHELKSHAAEILANQLFENTMKHYLKDFPSYFGEVIRGRPEYIINSTQTYIAKLISRERVVILKKNKKIDNLSDRKFGYINEAEVDGLYLLKRELCRDERRELNCNKERDRFLIAIETKTGENNLTLKHLKYIKERLQAFWKCPAHFALIGFKEDLYSDTRYNVLNEKSEMLSRELEKLGSVLLPIHFPFGKRAYDSLMMEVQEKRTGVLNVSGRYNSKTGEVELVDSSGNVYEGMLLKYDIKERVA